MKNLQIIFNMDGTGVYSNKYEPTHLDSLLMWVIAQREGREPPERNEPPHEIEIPCAKWKIGDVWGWKASAIFPIDERGEVVGWLRRRIRMDRLPYTEGGGIVIAGGEYMNKNIPVPKSLCPKMIGYCVGDKDTIRDFLSEVRYMGRYTSGGVGRVCSVDVHEIEDDWSCVMNDRAVRVLPKLDGFRICRVRPPYWNSFEKINVCEIGDVFTSKEIESENMATRSGFRDKNINDKGEGIYEEEKMDLHKLKVI